MAYYIASISWGKDSLAMLLRLIAEGWPLNEVIFFNTGMEFQAIYAVRNKVLKLLKEKGIKYTELEPKEPFLYSMLERPVESKQKGKHYGYGWCGGLCRWGTTEKNKAMDRYAEARNATVYVGIAADDGKRLQKTIKPYKVRPLVTWGMTESDCLTYCYKNGFFWEEPTDAGIVRLYDILDRVSCWCCCNKNLQELKNMRKYLPDYWKRLKQLQIQIERPMKGYYKGKPSACLSWKNALRERRRIDMERLSKELTGIINEQDFCFTPGEMSTVEKALGRFAAYEDTLMEPDRLRELAQAEKAGRLVVLDEPTALAMAAGARAIENSKSLEGASYVYDFLGVKGGPKEITYYRAAKLLRTLVDPILKGRPRGEEADNG